MAEPPSVSVSVSEKVRSRALPLSAVSASVHTRHNVNSGCFRSLGYEGPLSTQLTKFILDDICPLCDSFTYWRVILLVFFFQYTDVWFSGFRVHQNHILLVQVADFGAFLPEYQISVYLVRAAGICFKERKQNGFLHDSDSGGRTTLQEMLEISVML